MSVGRPYFFQVRSTAPVFLEVQSVTVSRVLYGRRAQVYTVKGNRNNANTIGRSEEMKKYLQLKAICMYNQFKTRLTRMPAVWEYLRHLRITHTIDSYQIPSQNKTN